MHTNTEIEARWLGIASEHMEERLAALGAQREGEYFFQEWIFQYPEWNAQHRRVRVRTDGKEVWVTYKANTSWGIDATEEIEFTASSAESAVAFFTAMELPLARAQEKKRTTYQLEDITFDIDTWPKIPPLLEIESVSEERVREGARLLGLVWDDAIFEDQKVLHKKYYDVDLDLVPDYRFSS